MAVNFEIKGMLARLLATEDLIVDHKNVETACFNVHTRVLTLPMWEKASAVVYDMLVAHEVSHALYTPDKDMTSLGVPHQFINVVEDVRVEKLIKRRYMGLGKTFYSAYQNLQQEDFFCLENEDISSMNLADRVNLYYKVGHFVEVNFNEEERELVNQIGDIETFEQTIEFAKKLYEFCKKEEEEKQQLPETNSHQQQGSGEQSPEQQTEVDDSGEEEDNSDNEQLSQQQSQSPSEQQSGGSQASPIGQSPEPKVKTADALQKAIEELAKSDSYENEYVEIPKLDLDTVIAKNKEIHDYIEDYYNSSQKFYDDSLNDKKYLSPRNIFENVDFEYQKFRTSAQKEVNYLVKEFECKKSADSYARASVSKTGVLDCSKLHTYKFNEDLFKKVTTLADGKNHGLIFVLDWSGSMADVMLDTIKQLFNLVWFCKKVAIPFEVYAFTGEWARVTYDKNNIPVYPKPHYEKKEGIFQVHEQFSLMNFLTSKVNGKTLEQQMKNIWRVASSFRGYSCSVDCPYRIQLSGTPLNETMIALHSIIPHFQKENKLQKVQCVVLTDGEASPIPYHVEVRKNNFTEPYIGTRRVYAGSTFLRDRKLGTTYNFGYDYHEFTDTLIRNLRDKFPYVNFIGMRIMEGRDAGYFVDRYFGTYGQDHDKAMSEWKKNKSFFTQKTAYTGYFGLSANALNQESEFDVADGATKTQIKTAFAKSLKSKKLNKKVLGEFVNLIA
jgi:hypothetical protein